MENKEENVKIEEFQKVEEIKEEDKTMQEVKAVTKSNSFGLLKLVWRVIKTVLILVALLVFAVIIVQRVSHNKASIAGYGVYTIVSESMVPEYNIWDMLFAKKVDPATINVGDDVVYQGKEGDFVDKIVTHRVIKKRYDGQKYSFVTKGIANDIEDPAINEDQVYGKVVLKSTALSFLSKVINNEYGFYFIVFVPLVIIISLEVIDTVNERKQLKRD